jgi:hypothetical protein
MNGLKTGFDVMVNRNISVPARKWITVIQPENWLSYPSSFLKYNKYQKVFYGLIGTKKFKTFSILDVACMLQTKSHCWVNNTPASHTIFRRSWFWLLVWKSQVPWLRVSMNFSVPPRKFWNSTLEKILILSSHFIFHKHFPILHNTITCVVEKASWSKLKNNICNFKCAGTVITYYLTHPKNGTSPMRRSLSGAVARSAFVCTKWFITQRR